MYILFADVSPSKEYKDINIPDQMYYMNEMTLKIMDFMLYVCMSETSLFSNLLRTVKTACDTKIIFSH